MAREVRFREALGVFARIGFQSFGGPAGQIATMHRILVDERGYLDEAHFLHALNFCMLLPGPEAQELSVYAGWLLHGLPGGIAAGTLFVLPGFVTMLALSSAYTRWQSVPLVDGVMFGLKAAVVAIVAGALVRVGRRALRGVSAWGLAAGALVALAVFGAPFPAVVLTALLLGLAYPGAFAPIAGDAAGAPPTEPPVALSRAARTPPHTRRLVRTLALGLAIWAAPTVVLAATLGREHVLVVQGLFFSKAALVTFGGAYAVLSYVSVEAVARGWLLPAEMLDGLGLAETTPGPLILVVQFVAFVGAWRAGGAAPSWPLAVAASALVAWTTFVPSFVWVAAGAPYVESVRRSPRLRGALAAVTAAIVGVIANLSVAFTMHALFASVPIHTAGPLRVAAPVLSTLRPAAALLAVAAVAAVFGLRWGTGRLLAACALAGTAYVLLVGHA